MVFLFLYSVFSALIKQSFNKNHIKELSYFLFGLLCGIWFISLGAVHFDLVFYPGDLGDARFNNYLLEHGYRYLVGQDKYFWNADFMYPEAEVISYSDNLLGTVPFYALCRVFGADRETAFQIWYLLMVVLNYTAAFFFFRFLVKNTQAAVLGAMIFAFSMALHSQLVHAQTFPRFMIPLSLWAALLYQKELRPRYFFLCLIAWVYQMYCGIYLGFMLLIPLLLILLSSFYTRAGLYKLKLKNKRWLLLQALSAVSAGIILLPLMLPYLRRAAQTGFYPYRQVIQSLPTPASFLYSRHGSYFWKWNEDMCVSYDNFWDFILFPGGIALICLVLVLLAITLGLKKKVSFISNGADVSIKLFFVVAVIVFVVFLRFGDFSFYRAIYYMPGFGSMRALQRIINIELVFFAAAAALVFSKVFKQKSNLNWLYFVVLVFLTVADNFVDHNHFDKSIKAISQTRVEQLVSKIDVSDKNTILSYEPDTVVKNQIHFQLDAMLAAQTLGIKTLNGYTATSPKGFDAYWRQPNEASRKVWLNACKLDSTHVQVLH